MIASFPLPRLLFGAGSVNSIAGELAALGVRRPLLVSDRGLERAGVVATALAALPEGTAQFLDVQPNPLLGGVDSAYAAYLAAGCDGVVALGGGSVIDTAKFLAALAGSQYAKAADIVGRPERIGPTVAPLVAVPTTLGSGSECSPAAGLHDGPTGAVVGTRSPLLVPRIAICDPDLARTLPRHLIAATGVDALSHCLEGFLAVPAHPVLDALALDGVARARRAVAAAAEGEGEAREALMAAAFMGGAAIHKGLGPAHTVALTCGDQDLHHGMLIAAALPLTIALMLPHVPPEDASRAAAALGVRDPADIPDSLRALNDALGLANSFKALGFRADSLDLLADKAATSHFNRTSAYVPTRAEYLDVLEALMV